MMKIQINTGENVEGSEDLSDQVSAEIQNRVDHFSKHITHIEVHLRDENADKSGSSDKRCLIEARLEGRKPTVVSDKASTIEAAYTGAAKKLEHALQSALGKLNHLKGSDTIRNGNQ